MNDETFNTLIQELIETLSTQILEYYEKDGRGVFFVDLDINEIQYVPEDCLSHEIEDADTLQGVMDAVTSYDPDKEICFMIFGEDEVTFHVATLSESGSLPI